VMERPPAPPGFPAALQQGQQVLHAFGQQLAHMAGSWQDQWHHQHPHGPHGLPLQLRAPKVSWPWSQRPDSPQYTEHEAQSSNMPFPVRRAPSHASLTISTQPSSAGISDPLTDAQSAPGMDDSAAGALAASQKAELGRSTWLLLHTMAAQYPERPSKQQQRDVRELISCLTRVYPCGDCASHFHEIVKRSPPNVGSKYELQQWMCRVHNLVNVTLKKPVFNCQLVASRWSRLQCGEADELGPVASCDMNVGLPASSSPNVGGRRKFSGGGQL